MSAQIGQDAVIVTLFEGDYHLGVGALVNSLHAHGFRGVFYAAYRGELAGWAAAATPGEAYSELNVAEGLVVRLVKLGAGWHLANLKPSFMLRVLEEFEPNATSVFYFDPDIVIKCRWSFYEEWIEAGIAMVCENYMSPMPESHPFRFQWMQALSKVGFAQMRSVDFYVNSGFVGAKRSQASFIGQWKAVMEGAEKLGRDMSQYKTGDQTEPFNSCDQDWLNCAVMTTDEPISIIGPEGMDLKPGGVFMSHAIESLKPWRKGMGKQVSKGFVPSQPMRNFWNYTQSPIQVYPAGYVKWKRFKIGIAVLITRFYRKG